MDTIFGSHGHNGTTLDFNGAIDDFRIFNRGLSTTEIYKIVADSSFKRDITTVGLAEGYYLPSIRPVQDYVR